ncbi:MAG: hypothetical protein WC374_07515 [Phycisphaerae bacterium]|jgi:hypothetical protein
MKILNLDEITSDDRKVVIAGEEYVIPGDLPVDVMLRLIGNSNKIQENPNDITAMRDGIDILVGVFQIRNPNVDIDGIKKNITMARYSRLMSFAFGDFEEAEKKPQDDSGPPQ